MVFFKFGYSPAKLGSPADSSLEHLMQIKIEMMSMESLAHKWHWGGSNCVSKAMGLVMELLKRKLYLKYYKISRYASQKKQMNSRESATTVSLD